MYHLKPNPEDALIKVCNKSNSLKNGLSSFNPFLPELKNFGQNFRNFFDFKTSDIT